LVYNILCSIWSNPTHTNYWLFNE